MKTMTAYIMYAIMILDLIKKRKKIIRLLYLYLLAIPSAISSSNSLLNKVLTRRALEEESIANELSQTFSHRNLANPSARARRNYQESIRTFDSAAATNFNVIIQSTSRRNSRVESTIREAHIQVILLPDVGNSSQ